jgi:pantetheine-phosphate adenylyltransferase
MVLYPGTFDPPTYGHLDVIHRAARIFDAIEIVIANNPMKRCVFSPEERYEMLFELTADVQNVNIHIWDGLIVDFAEKKGIRVILRGVRPLSDFDYEFELSLTYKALNPNIETIFMPTDQKYLVLRSTTIKELAMFGGNISKMVPPVVVEALKGKIEALGERKLDTEETIG